MSAEGIVWHFEIAEQRFPTLKVPQMTLNTQTLLNKSAGAVSERWNWHFLQIHSVLQCSRMPTYNFPHFFTCNIMQIYTIFEAT